MTSREFCVDLLQQTGVMLTPGDAFDMEGYVRIGYANNTDVLVAGLERLAGYLAALAN
jgi:aspartate/methionine/tyrosine aminotransferase